MTLYHGAVLPSPCIINGQKVSCVENCGGTCSSNSFWAAYPHYHECGTHSCSFKTSLAKATYGCGAANGIMVQASCNANGLYGTPIKDCGPGFGSIATSLCSTGTHKGLASVPPVVFHYITGSSKGRAYLEISVF